MLCFLVVFIVLTAFKQCALLVSLQVAISHSDNSSLSTYLLHPYHNTITCAMDDLFPLEDNTMRSIWHLYCAGRETHNTGLMTHNTIGHVTHYYSLMLGCPTLSPVRVSSKWHHDVTAMTNRPSYPSCLCHDIIIMPSQHKLHNLSENNENHGIVFDQPCFGSATVTIYVLPYKGGSHSWFDPNIHKWHCPALALILAINRSIYYLLNSTFNRSHDVDHLISQLLLMLQRYITRSNDFKHRWLMLLLSGLLSSQKFLL